MHLCQSDIFIRAMLFWAYQVSCESCLYQIKVKCAINYEAAILSMLCDDCKFACMNMKTNCV